MKRQYDVIVVGGGGSGLAAGLSAAEHGMSVLLLEKQPNLGGTTGIAIGSFTANGTRWQREVNIQDNVEDHEADASLFGPDAYQAKNNAALRRYFLSESSATLEWLRSMGLAFHGPSPEPPNRVPRMHNVIPNAKAYIAVLQTRFLRAGGEIRTDAAVSRVLQESDRAIGVEVIMNERPVSIYSGRGVVLAAGDYANSSELIGRYIDPRLTEVEGINPHATGDGQRLAEQCGARLVNMEIAYGPELRFVPSKGKTFAQLLPAKGVASRLMGLVFPMVPQCAVAAMIKRLLVTWQHPEDSLFDDGAIMVNQIGQRFVNERMEREREIAVAHQPGKIAYS